jgi:hypothetical protein
MITALTLTNGTITVILDNGAQILTARNDHPKWNEILEAYKAGNENRLTSLISMKSVVETFSNGELSVNGTGVMFKGRPLHGVDANRVLAFLRDGLPYQPIANYMLKKMENSSSRAINEMYAFLEHGNMALTPSGNFIAYKGVQDDFYSVRGNKDTIVIQGTVNSEGQVLNSIGATIEVQRNCVDDNFNNACGQGLHAGSLRYATGWSNNVILVEIDPRDVVSIPSDSNCQKLRCCKYKVIGKYVGPLPDTYSTEFSSDEPKPEVTIDDDESEIDYDELDMEDDDEDESEDITNELTTIIDNFLSANSDESVRENQDDKLETLSNIVSKHCYYNNPVINPNPTNDETTDSLIDIANKYGISGSDNKKNEFLSDMTNADYIEGKRSGNRDAVDLVSPRYLSGDHEDADSTRHSDFIRGYVSGYNS